MILRRYIGASLIATSLGVSNAFLPSNFGASSRAQLQVVSMQGSQGENDLFENLPAEAEPIRTIGGGADMIFEMARQMLLWDETSEDSSAFQTKQQQEAKASAVKQQQKASVLPRWRPIRGVSDANPSFRTAAPMMNSQGYAGR